MDFLSQLTNSFIQYETWIQSQFSGEPNRDKYFSTLIWLGEQDPHAYHMYRDSVFLYINEMSGKGDVQGELIDLIDEFDNKHPTAMHDFWNEYKQPDIKFPIQWQNVHDIIVQPPLLSPQSVFLYQQKYEIELFLKIFTQLKEIEKTGNFDKLLARFQDKAGKLKKGNLISFFLAGFKHQPNLLSCLEKAYSHKLRNVIGHNEYRIAKNEILSIDGNLSISDKDFGESLFCIQTIQNLVYWLLSHDRNPNKTLGKCGVLGCHFLGFSDNSKPSIIVFQLSPFFNIDDAMTWCKKISVDLSHGKIITQVGESEKVTGPLLPEIPNICKGIADNNPVICRLIPVMPHVRGGDIVHMTGIGNFAQYGKTKEVLVDFEVIY